jgi:hypothetical protein
MTSENVENISKEGVKSPDFSLHPNHTQENQCEKFYLFFDQNMVAVSAPSCFTVISPDDASERPSLQELRSALEKGSEGVKIDTMKAIIIGMLNGESYEQLLMHVIRFVMPSRNKQLKKLLHYYWEVCPKTNPDGKLKQEMILVW